MAARREITVTEGGIERQDRVYNTLLPEFRTDTVFMWMLGDISKPRRQPVFEKLFAAFIKGALLNSGRVFEANSWGASAILMPPGKKLDNPWTILQAGLAGIAWETGFTGLKRMMAGYPNPVERAKTNALTPEELSRYWYVQVIGTSANARRQGLAGGLIRRMQEEARKDNAPLWLEATSANSRDCYKKQGFQVVEEIVLGKGEAGVDGMPKKDGPGFSIYAMVWRPGRT